MASKKGQLTTELTTDKEWRDFIRRPGLLVVDLFSDWAGPCVAMNTPLKTLKTSDMAYDWLHLASAPTSIVPAMKRFEGTSRPTFVLLSGGRLVNVIYGCNAPRVIDTIKAEIEREIRVSKGEEKRTAVSLTQMCPAEQEMQAARLAAEGDTLLTEETRKAMEADRVLRNILTQIANNLPDTTLVVAFPYALQAEQCDSVLKSLRDKWTEMGFSVMREEYMELTKEAVDLMFWERRLPQHDALVESVTQGASLVLMLERPNQVEEGDQEREEDEDEEEEGSSGTLRLEAIVARTIYGFLPGTGSSMEFITPVENGGFEEEDEGQDTSLPEESQDGDKTVELKEEKDDDEDVETAAPSTGAREDDEQEDEDHKEEEEEDEEEYEAAELEPRKSIDQQEDEEGEGEDARDKAGDEEGEDEQEIPEEQDDDSLRQLLGERSSSVSGSPVGGLASPMRVWNPRELLPGLDSAAAHLLFRPDESGPALPGLWTPLTPLTKAAAVKALFPNMAEQLYTPPSPPTPPPPPMSVVCFSGDKREEVLDLASSFPSEVTRYGFFTKSRKLLATSRQDYDKLVRVGLQATKTLLVLEVSRVRSAPLLELSSAGPQYVSATPAIAENDVEDFFGSRCTPATPDDVREITKVVEQVPEPEPEVEQAVEQSGSLRSSTEPTGEVPAEPVPGELPAEPAPAPPMLEAGEGSVAGVDQFQAGVLDVGEGDAPATGGEGDETEE